MKQILDQAAGDSTANYQGLGKFWHLPYQQFVELELYGVQMIAQVDQIIVDELNLDNPDEKKAYADACCPVPLVKNQQRLANVVQVVRPGRGKASGLIKGLRGEFPFNTEYFPRLPWGGTAVAPDDIRMIEQWIDEGCPENDTVLEAQVQAREIPLVFKAYNRSTNIFKRQFNQLKVRKNIDNLTPEEEEKLRIAWWQMVRLNYFPKDKRNGNYWGRLHGDECQHGWEQFLTWHRMFLYLFEQALQDIDPDVTLPYWDWTAPAYLNGQIPKFLWPDNPAYANAVSGVVPRSLRCWINSAAIERLRNTEGISKKVIAQLESIKGIRYNSGVEFFLAAGITDQQVKNLIYPQLALVNSMWYQFRYPGMFYQSNPDGSFNYSKQLTVKDGLANFHHHYPTKKDIENIMKIDNYRDFAGGPAYDQSFGILDMDPHNTIHIWSGGFNPNYAPLNCNSSNSSLSADPNEILAGDMLNNLTAGYDFIFWPHHANLDRLLHNWQKKFPNQLPDDLDATLVGLGFTVRDSLSIGKLGYEYVYDSHIFPTGRDLPIPGFQSDKIYLTENLLAHQGKVELRIHQMDQPQYSYGMRVFLNDEKANVNTGIQDNPNYAGYLSFFGHGDCIGGPGHCDPPPNEKRSNDIRPRHHNTPGNFKLDITEQVRRLKEKGATTLSVKIVAIDPGGHEKPTMKMDGVSINFLD